MVHHCCCGCCCCWHALHHTRCSSQLLYSGAAGASDALLAGLLWLPWGWVLGNGVLCQVGLHRVKLQAKLLLLHVSVCLCACVPVCVYVYLCVPVRLCVQTCIKNLIGNWQVDKVRRGVQDWWGQWMEAQGGEGLRGSER